MIEIFDDPSEQAPPAWTPQTYVEALQAGQRIELPAECSLRGRILRGREDDDFEVLGTAGRDIVFVMGPDGLSGMPGVEPLTALDRIGLTPHYIQGRVAQGYRFKLLVFEGGHAAPLATWDNALDMVAACHADLGPDIERHRNILKATPFSAWQASMTQSIEDIELAGPSHPDYMSLERYRALPKAERANPLMLRRLLFHAEHLATLFQGDGYTRTSDGQIGLAEYLIPNGRVASLPDALVIDFTPPEAL